MRIKKTEEDDLLCATERIADRNLYRSRLINLVRVNPILWDKKSPDFNQRVAKIKKWMEVAKELGVTTDKIRRTWENLRDQYRRDLKRIITTGSSSKWRFFKDMNFIRSMVRIKGSGHQRHSDSDSDYDEFVNDHFHETFSSADMLPISGLATSNPALPTFITTTSNASVDFSPIILNTDWKQRTSNMEQLQEEQLQTQQSEATRNQLQLKREKKNSQNQLIAHTQQECDSSEGQKSADEDEACAVELSVLPHVIKVELESDSNDEKSKETSHMAQQQSFKLNQSQKLQYPQQQQRQPPMQQEPSHEPRPSAPIPSTYQHESEEFVTTSESAIKRRKRYLSNQTNATVGDQLSSYYRSQCPLAPSTEAELQDEDYHFVMSILPSLRQVTRQRKFPLRSQIMSLISKELDENND